MGESDAKNEIEEYKNKIKILDIPALDEWGQLKPIDQMSMHLRLSNMKDMNTEICTQCNGKGKTGFFRKKCGSCEGSGEVKTIADVESYMKLLLKERQLFESKIQEWKEYKRDKCNELRKAMIKERMKLTLKDREYGEKMRCEKENIDKYERIEGN